ncbi:MAG: hypothetical protein LAP87_10185 [Acidobacteriia bacterium]|nr:hypothetical protein [Terriglobia bacterium]
MLAVKVKVTLTLNKDLWREFRAAAIRRGTSASAEIERLLSQQLGKGNKTMKAGIQILILACLIAVPSMAQQPRTNNHHGTPLPGFGTQDTPAHYAAECTVAMVGAPSFDAPCAVEDLGSHGSHVRFHILLRPPTPDAVSAHAPAADYVRAENMADGCSRVASALVGSIEIRANSKEVRDWATQHSPVHDVRPQHIAANVNYDGSGLVEILVRSDAEDAAGDLRTPSAQWLAQYAADYQAMCR